MFTPATLLAARAACACVLSSHLKFPAQTGAATAAGSTVPECA